jgi:hypothetical protein
MHAFLVSTLQQRGGHGVDADQIWTQLQHVVVDQLGVRPEEVTPTARFVDDLRAD